MRDETVVARETKVRKSNVFRQAADTRLAEESANRTSGS